MAASGGGLKGFIRCYGMFWDRDEVDWSPGAGNANQYRLLGRFGKVQPKLAVCDFRAQRGIYVLYDDHGPHYVGLARPRHRKSSPSPHPRPPRQFMATLLLVGFRRVLIGDVEALLIQALGTYRTGNSQQMRFAAADRWEQVRHDERATYIERVAN